MQRNERNEIVPNVTRLTKNPLLHLLHNLSNFKEPTGLTRVHPLTYDADNLIMAPSNHRAPTSNVPVSHRHLHGLCKIYINTVDDSN